jgi:hypothetical protein
MLENMNTASPFLTGIIEGEFMTYCYQVKCGSKPIAFTTLKTKYIDLAVSYVKEKYSLNTYIEEIENCPEWKIIYIYKHDYLIEIIKYLPKNPQTSYDHWIIGKACGYSDDAIGEFLSKRVVK